jgi:hypothetical protein
MTMNHERIGGVCNADLPKPIGKFVRSTNLAESARNRKRYPQAAWRSAGARVGRSATNSFSVYGATGGTSIQAA